MGTAQGPRRIRGSAGLTDPGGIVQAGMSRACALGSLPRDQETGTERAVQPSTRSLRLWRAAALVLAVGLLAAAVPAGAAPKDSRFRITDELGPDQVEELITVGIDGRTIGILHVTKDDPVAQLQVKVPAGRPVRYELCGFLIVLTPEGTRRQHPINHTGTIEDAEGRELKAFNQNNEIFYLQDGAPGDAGAAKTTIVGTGQCAQPVA